MIGPLLALLFLQGASSIDGMVVHASDQQPLAQAQIVAVPLGGPLKDSRVAVSGAGGRFSINELAPGSYRLFVEHDGFMRAEYGQRSAGKAGVPVEVARGDNVSGVIVPLTPTATIYGRVMNASNDPVINATVQALKPSYKDGERTLQTVQSAKTSDLGEYRLFGLAPGSYFLSVTPIPSPSISGGTLTTPSGSGVSLQPLTILLAAGNLIDPRALDVGTEVTIYAPGTADPAAAAAIDLKAGVSYRAPDLRTLRTRSFAVRGQVVDEAGQPANIAIATLNRVGSTETTRTNPLVQNRSTFEFVGVLPGTYELNATSNATTGTVTAADRVGFLAFTLNSQDADNLRLVLRPVIEVKGRIQHDGATVPTSLRVQLRGTGSRNGVQVAPAGPDGSFTITRLTPGDYRLSFTGLPDNVHVRSARLGTADVLNSNIPIKGAVSESLEVVLGANTGSLQAVVLDRNNQPSAAAIVVLVPNPDRRQRFDLYRTGTTDASGRTTLSNIAPGAYTLFAWQDIEPDAWQNADALRPFEDRGVTVYVGENAKSNQNVTVIE